MALVFSATVVWLVTACSSGNAKTSNEPMELYCLMRLAIDGLGPDWSCTPREEDYNRLRALNRDELYPLVDCFPITLRGDDIGKRVFCAPTPVEVEGIKVYSCSAARCPQHGAGCFDGVSRGPV